MTALYGFAYSEVALKFLETVQPVKIRGQIKKKIEALASNPNPPGSKKLRGPSEGDEPIFRERSGDYRIIYAVRDNPEQIVILEIGHRKDVYR